MFDFIKGKKTYIDPLSIILENDFYGFRLLITYNSYTDFSATDQIKAYVYTQMINDSIFLYGFSSDSERTFFKLLIGSVSGIGPKLAIRILSHISYISICQSIISEDAKAISQLPGIGLKTAQKIILELKEKIPHLGFLQNQNIEPSTQIFTEAFIALENFGFDSVKIKSALQVFQSQNKNWELSALIKEMLIFMNKK